MSVGGDWSRYDMVGGHTLNYANFWRAVDRRPGPGDLLVVALTTWKHNADTFGHEPGIATAAVFDTVCKSMTTRAIVHGVIGWLLFGAYFEDPEVAAVRVVERLNETLPITLEWGRRKDKLAIECATVVVERERNESGSSLYARAQPAVVEMWERVPEERRWVGLTDTWEKALRGPTRS